MAEKLQFDLDVASNNLKKALAEAQSQVAKLESNASKVKLDPNSLFKDFVPKAVQASDSITKISKETNKLSDETNAFGRITDYVYGNLIANAVATATNAVINFAKGSIDAYAEQELAINRLNGALESTGQFTDKTSESLIAYANAMQQTTRFSDDVTLSSLALLSSLTKLNTEGLQRATTGAANLAARFGKDLPGVVETLGRAFNGQTKGLKEFGISFKDTGDKAKNFEGIMKLIEQRFGGAAQKDLETYSGKAANLGNTIGELQEALGKLALTSADTNGIMGKIAEIFGYATDKLNKYIDRNSDTDSVAKFEAQLEDLEDRLYNLNKAQELNSDWYGTLIEKVTGAASARKQEIAEIEKEIEATKRNLALQEQVSKEKEKSQQAKNQEKKLPEEESEVEKNRIEKTRVAEAEITAIKQQGLTARRDAQIQSDILDIEDSNLRAQAEIDFIYLQAEEQANAKLLAKQNENSLLATEEETRLANKKAMAERELAITQATVAREAAIKKQRIALDKEISAAQGQLAIDALNLGMALSKQGSSSYKTFANAQAIMSTYLAANKAMAEVPYPANIAAVASTIAVGLANVARINSITAFESGGMIGVGSIDQGILRGGPSSGDKTLFRGNAGEVVLNEANQETLANKLTSSQSSPVIRLYLNSREIAYAIREEVQAGFKLA